MTTNPLHAAHYADRCTQATTEVVENKLIAQDTMRLRFHFPELANVITPGQFLMIRLPNCEDPLIGRPLAVYDVHFEGEFTGTVDVVYLVKGKLTSRLQHVQKGENVEVWGPLGNGFGPQQTEHLIMVAGGIGQTPFVALAQEALGLKQYGDPKRVAPRIDKVTLCYGARTEALLAGVEDFERIGVETLLATDDGSCGKQGLVTDLLREQLQLAGQHKVVCCGPEVMMEAVAMIANEMGAACEVSLETPMACGIGICFSCVAKVKDDQGEWDYKRTCVDGPVFAAEKIVW